MALRNDTLPPREIDPEDAVTKVVRAYEGCRLQGYGHEFAVGFVSGKLSVGLETIERALELRGVDTGESWS
jgi:hypothetical protein